MTDKLLRDYEVKKLGGRGTKVLLYPELNKYKDIDHLFDEHGNKIALLYINEQDDNSTTGHWVALLRNKRGKKVHYEIFDSYGKMPDEHFDEFPERLRKQLRQGVNKLTRLMYKRLKGNEADTVIEFNEIPYQRTDPRIATCGRWCGLRLRHGKIPLDGFQKIISDSKRPHDELVVDMSDSLLGVKQHGGSSWGDPTRLAKDRDMNTATKLGRIVNPGWAKLTDSIYDLATGATSGAPSQAKLERQAKAHATKQEQDKAIFMANRDKKKVRLDRYLVENPYWYGWSGIESKTPGVETKYINQAKGPLPWKQGKGGDFNPRDTPCINPATGKPWTSAEWSAKQKGLEETLAVQRKYHKECLNTPADQLPKKMPDGQTCGITPGKHPRRVMSGKTLYIDGKPYVGAGVEGGRPSRKKCCYYPDGTVDVRSCRSRSKLNQPFVDVLKKVPGIGSVAKGLEQIHGKDQGVALPKPGNIANPFTWMTSGLAAANIAKKAMGEGYISRKRIKIIKARPKTDEQLLIPLPSYIKDFIKTNGDVPIAYIEVCREPVMAAMEKAANLITAGKYNKDKLDRDFDKMFHLFMVIGLENGKRFVYEKNQKITLFPTGKDFSQGSSKGAECRPVPGVSAKNITFGEMVLKAIKRVGIHQYSDYDILSRNCQKFVADNLAAVGLLSPTLKSFIEQNVTDIIPKYAQAGMRGFVSIAAALTELGHKIFGKKVPDILDTKKDKLEGKQIDHPILEKERQKKLAQVQDDDDDDDDDDEMPEPSAPLEGEGMLRPEMYYAMITGSGFFFGTI